MSYVSPFGNGGEQQQSSSSNAAPSYKGNYASPFTPEYEERKKYQDEVKRVNTFNKLLDEFKKKGETFSTMSAPDQIRFLDKAAGNKFIDINEANKLAAQVHSGWKKTQGLEGAVNKFNQYNPIVWASKNIIAPGIEQAKNTYENAQKAIDASIQGSVSTKQSKIATDKAKKIIADAEAGKTSWESAQKQVKSIQDIYFGKDSVYKSSKEATKKLSEIDPTEAATDAAMTYINIALMTKGFSKKPAIKTTNLGRSYQADLAKKHLLSRTLKSGTSMGGIGYGYSTLNKMGELGSQAAPIAGPQRLQQAGQEFFNPEVQKAGGVGAATGFAVGAATELLPAVISRVKNKGGYTSKVQPSDTLLPGESTDQFIPKKVKVRHISTGTTKLNRAMNNVEYNKSLQKLSNQYDKAMKRAEKMGGKDGERLARSVDSQFSKKFQQLSDDFNTGKMKVTTPKVTQSSKLTSLEKAATMDKPKMPGTRSKTIGIDIEPLAEFTADVNYTKNMGTLKASYASKVSKINKSSASATVKANRISKLDSVFKAEVTTQENIARGMKALNNKNIKPPNVVSRFIAKSKKLRFLQNTENNIRGMGETGQKMHTKLQRQALTEGMRLSEGERILTKLQKVQNKGKFWNAVEARDITKLSGKAETSLYDDVVRLFDTRADEMVNAGIKMGRLEKYFPKMLNPKTKAEAADWLIAHGRSKDAENILNIYKNKLTPSKASSEFHRSIVGLPEKFYIQDKAMRFANWNRETAGRVAEAQTWGSNMQYMADDISNISTKVGKDSADYIKRFYDVYRYGVNETGSVAGGLLKGARTLQVVTKMPLSVISNATQSVNTAARGGITNTAKNVKRYFTNRGALENTALNSGVNVHYLTDDLNESLRKLTTNSKSTSAASWMLKHNGFQSVEKFNRLVASGTGGDYVKQLAKSPLTTKNARLLRQLNLDPKSIAKNGLQADDLSMGVRSFVGDTQFFTSAKDLPLWTSSSELGKTVTHLAKFGMKQSEFYKNAIIKEATKGNVAPLLRWMVVGTAAGEMANLVGNTITGKKREYNIKEIFDSLSDDDLNKVAEMVASRSLENVDRVGGFGYLGGGISSMKYGKTLPEKVIKGFGGPVFNDAYDIISIVSNLFDEDTGSQEYGAQQLTKFGIKNTPLLDPLLTAGKTYGGIDYEELGLPKPVGKALDVSATRYDPRTSKYWETKKDHNLMSVSQDDINETVELERQGKDISGTALAGALASKADRLQQETKKKGIDNSKEISKLEQIMNDLGISSTKALKSKDRADKEKINQKKKLSTTEKNFLSKGRNWTNAYLKDNKKSLKDYPTLEAFTDEYGW